MAYSYIQRLPIAVELQVCFMALLFNSVFSSSTVQFVSNFSIVHAAKRASHGPQAR